MPDADNEAVDVEEDADDEFTCRPCDDIEPLKHGSSPIMPSATEVEEHRAAGHVQYRSWCSECVKGRGLGEQRGRHEGRPHTIPVIGIDYWYITETGIQRRGDIGYGDDADGEAKLLASRQDGTIVKCVLVRDYCSKNVFGHVVPCKGVNEENFVVKLIVDDVAWLGHTRVILKSDQERSLVALVTKAMTTMRYTIDKLEAVTKEHSAKYDSQANGGTEVGVRALRGQFRTMRLCLEKRVGRKIPVRHPLTSWLLEHAALLLNASVRGEDGLTSWARVRGRPFGQRLVGFGEYILWKLPTKGPQHDEAGNMASRMLPGIFVGYNRAANTYRIAVAT